MACGMSTHPHQTVSSSSLFSEASMQIPRRRTPESRRRREEKKERNASGIKEKETKRETERERERKKKRGKWSRRVHHKLMLRKRDKGTKYIRSLSKGFRFIYQNVSSTLRHRSYAPPNKKVHLLLFRRRCQFLFSPPFLFLLHHRFSIFLKLYSPPGWWSISPHRGQSDAATTKSKYWR